MDGCGVSVGGVQYEYVVAVVLHCCLHEKSFNLFYTRVLQHCCGLPEPIAKHYQRALTKVNRAVRHG